VMLMITTKKERHRVVSLSLQNLIRRSCCSPALHYPPH